MASTFLTLDEAAALARVHPDTLRKSRCPRIQRRARGRILFDRDAVLRWMVHGDTPAGRLEVA